MDAPSGPVEPRRGSALPVVAALLLLAGSAVLLVRAIGMYAEAASIPLECMSYALDVPEGIQASAAAETLQSRLDGVVRYKVEGAQEQLIVVRIQGGHFALVNLLLTASVPSVAERSDLPEDERKLAMERIGKSPLTRSLRIRDQTSAPPVDDPGKLRGRGTAFVLYGIALAVAAGALIIWGRR